MMSLATRKETDKIARGANKAFSRFQQRFNVDTRKRLAAERKFSRGIK
ncbi:hypothetical protein LCGC14_0971190 [marine sediment metagenome]|uniref:Uncharacterized protein n=1 Tax=marine sediment metagenome TaxID=412755 RepID=A0A0F9NG39_9ZZZZ